ncbi:MAG TPA: FAD-binding oxidoreductase [Candidatus Limnocylindria bacterium]|jgi:glycolate oxidase FAD binding subunit|nr:FAD-binding oxidoreductase [Candidatus Limnocylindria bacterium]
MDAATKSEASGLHSALRYKFIALVGNEYVRAATAADAVAGAQPKLVIEPGTQRELAEILRLSNGAGLAVIPRGGGTKLGWGNSPARADVILSTARITEIIEHAWADLTVTVEAGCTVQRLQETLGQHGQRLALDALWPEKATVGGVLCTNDSGALRLRFGALRDLIIGVTIALPDGTLASSGGKVVKNVAGYDLPKLVTGALGTLGVVTRAVFRLHPLPLNSHSFSISTVNAEETQKLVLAVQDSKLAHTFLQSHFSDEKPPASDILFEGTEAGLAAQETQLRNLAAPESVSEASNSSWTAREELWAFSDPASAAIAKISILPTNMARTMKLVAHSANAQQVRWKALLYATGLGWLRLEGKPGALQKALQVLRDELQGQDGWLVALHRPSKMPAFDAWGTAGDALPLMKAVKQQLDPKNTLNPGRFVGGI